MLHGFLLGFLGLTVAFELQLVHVGMAGNPVAPLEAPGTAPDMTAYGGRPCLGIGSSVG